MSWSFCGIGKAPKVAEKAQAELNRYQCVGPEESVKVAVRDAIAVALAAQSPETCVRVSASGHQAQVYDSAGQAGGVNNSLTLSIEPIPGFIE